MISNDERRKVAARLRNYENLRESFRESPICAFLDALAVEYFDWKGVCNRLADLIEPEPERTCKIDGTYDDEFGIYDHLSCGHVAMRQWPEKTNYCPNCGAKVVE